MTSEWTCSAPNSTQLIRCEGSTPRARRGTSYRNLLNGYDERKTRIRQKPNWDPTTSLYSSLLHSLKCEFLSRLSRLGSVDGHLVDKIWFWGFKLFWNFRHLTQFVLTYDFTTLEWTIYNFQFCQRDPIHLTPFSSPWARHRQVRAFLSFPNPTSLVRDAWSSPNVDRAMQCVK